MTEMDRDKMIEEIEQILWQLCESGKLVAMILEGVGPELQRKWDALVKPKRGE